MNGDNFTTGAASECPVCAARDAKKRAQERYREAYRQQRVREAAQRRALDRYRENRLPGTALYACGNCGERGHNIRTCPASRSWGEE